MAQNAHLQPSLWRFHSRETDPCATRSTEALGEPTVFSQRRERSKPFDRIKKTLRQMEFPKEYPVDIAILFAGRVSLDVRRCVQINAAREIGVIGRVHDDMPGACRPVNQADCLPLPRRDGEADGRANASVALGFFVAIALLDGPIPRTSCPPLRSPFLPRISGSIGADRRRSQRPRY